MYTVNNYKSKAALKKALQEGEIIDTYQPSGMFPPTTDGRAYLEGPHYPAPHTWHAQVDLVDGIVVKVVS